MPDNQERYLLNWKGHGASRKDVVYSAYVLTTAVC